MAATDIVKSKEFAIIYAGMVIAYCTDFTLQVNKAIIDITKLGDDWKQKLPEIKDYKVNFNGMITRGETIIALLWNPLTAYTVNQYCVIGGKGYKALGSTTGHNPLTDAGVHWQEITAYAAGTTYASGALVYYTTVANENRIYKSLQASNLGHDPAASPTWWERLDVGFSVLLHEVKYNDVPVKVTIKPNVSGTLYYYGNGLLTSLNAATKAGDKTTFAGSFESDGILNHGTTP